MENTNRNFFYARLGIVISVIGCGLLSLFVSFGNITDYWTNFEFVKHVLSMDTIFPDSKVKYRSIENSSLHHAFYISIIFAEVLISYFILSGSIKMIINIKNEPSNFQQSKKDSFIGLALGIALWFIGFEVIGGEWFSIWQSSTWNGLNSANRIVIFYAITYTIMLIPEKNNF
jgi:predicted small integral membrane protein